MKNIAIALLLLLLCGSATAQTTYFSSDFESGMPATLSVSGHQSFSGGTVREDHACQVLAVGANTDNGNPVVAHSGTKALVCSAEGTGGTGSVAWNGANLYLGSGACNGSAVGSPVIGGPCNPAAANADGLWISYWQYYNQPSLDNITSAGSGALTSAQQKKFLGRFLPGYPTNDQWFMVSFGRATDEVIKTVEHASEDSAVDTGKGSYTTGISLQAGVWYHYVMNFKRDTLTHCGHPRLWIGTEAFPVNTAAAPTVDPTVTWPGWCFAGYGSDDLTAQQTLQMGLVYSQDFGNNGTDVIEDDMSVGDFDPTAATAAKPVSPAGGTAIPK